MLSQQVLQICGQHYRGFHAKVNGCDRCPIREQCITHKPTHTEQELAAWRESVNEAADKWLREQEMSQ